MWRLPTNRGLLTLLAILCVATVLRGWNLPAQSFNVDEVYEVTAARETVSDLIYAVDSMPPLFPLVLKGWLAVVGTDAAARWLSVLFGVLSIVCLWGAVREAAGERAALVSAAVAAVSPFHIYYSQLVRAYMLYMLLAALAAWMLIRALQDNRLRDWAAFALAAIAGMYTHYYFAVFLAVCMVAIGTYAVAARSGLPSWQVCRRAAATMFLVAIASSGTILTFTEDYAYQSGHREPRPFSVELAGYTYLSFFSGYTLGPSRAALNTMSGAEAMRAVMPWTLAIGGCLAAIAVVSFHSLRRRRLILPLVLWIVMPVLLTGGLGALVGVSFHVRHIVWCWLGVAAWLGVALADVGAAWNEYTDTAVLREAGRVDRWRLPFASVAAVGLLIVSGCAVYNRHYVARYGNEDFRTAGRFLANITDEQSPIFVLSDYLANPIDYYSDSCHRVIELPVPGEINHPVRTEDDIESALAVVTAHADPDGTFWLVYSRGFDGDPKGRLLDRLHCETELVEAADLSGVKIYRGRLCRPAEKLRGSNIPAK